MTTNAHWTAKRIAARREDLEWLASWGETTETAAKRLGLKERSLGAWCTDNAPDLWAALVANSNRTGLKCGRVALGRVG